MVANFCGGRNFCRCNRQKGYCEVENVAIHVAIDSVIAYINGPGVRCRSREGKTLDCQCPCTVPGTTETVSLISATHSATKCKSSVEQAASNPGEAHGESCRTGTCSRTRIASVRAGACTRDEGRCVVDATEMQ